MPAPLAFFVGSAASFNVQQLVTNLGWMFDGVADVHLITTDPAAFPETVTSAFDCFGGSHDQSVRGEWRALTEYLGIHDPAVLTQLTRPPIHGTLVGLAGRRVGVPTVYRYAGDRFCEYRIARGKQRLTGFALGNVLGRVPLWLADEYLVFGLRGRSQLTTRGVDIDAITVLPPSVDATRFQTDRPGPHPIDVPDRRRIALFVGRLSYLKGMETFERTIPEILKRRSDLQFVFVGNTEDELDIKTRWRDHLTSVGSVDPAAMPAYYRQADLLVHPSLTDGIPRAVMEALAAETPVVARDVGDVSTITENTFQTDQQFVELVTAYETLPVDDIGPVTRDTLRPAYQQFFESFRHDGC